jgi:hypothetical protein
MRHKRFSAAALAAMALSGLFAAGAQGGDAGAGASSARETATFCVETKADAAFMASQPQDRESQRRAAQQLSPDQCLAVSFPRAADVFFAMNPCILREQQAHQDEIGAGREIIERCIAELPAGTVSKAKAKKKAHGKRGHRPPHAKIALAR